LPALAAPLARRAGGAIVEAARTLVRAPVLALGAAGRRLRQRFEEETVTRADVAFYVIALLAAVAGSLIALWAAQR